MDWVKQEGNCYVLVMGRFKATINKGRGQFWCVYSERRNGVWHFWYNGKPRKTLGEAKEVAQAKLQSVNELQGAPTQIVSPPLQQEYKSKRKEIDAWWHD